MFRSIVLWFSQQAATSKKQALHLKKKTLTLRHLILVLACAATAITLLNGFYANYQVQKKQLIQHSLDSNYAYAVKLASATERFLSTAKQQLAYAASNIQTHIYDTQYLDNEANRLRLQTDSFNSIVIANNTGFVLSTSPDTLEIKGQQLKSRGALQAIKEKRPLISAPYISAKNNLLVFISHPLYDAESNYIGYVGGSLYLKKHSILDDMLGTHYYKDGSYIYVVDQDRRIIYHPDNRRIGSIVNDNSVIDYVLDGKQGSAATINSQGIEMLAGYAPIPLSNWGVVTQRPVKATLASLDDLMGQVLYRTLPLGIVTFLLIWLLARMIARPLQQLADTAKTMDRPNTHLKLNNVRSWYFESSELKQAMLKGIGLLHSQIGQLRHDASTDPLTGVFNRRSLDLLLSKLEAKHTPFSVLALDIDHFKKVNDTYGHSVGDKALIKLSETMTQLSREQDIVARTGGEEFVLILPGLLSETALPIAERLREQVAQMIIPNIGSIHVSIGIACYAKGLCSSKQILKQADQALYEAKHQGRNRCVVFESTMAEA